MWFESNIRNGCCFPEEDSTSDSVFRCIIQTRVQVIFVSGKKLEVWRNVIVLQSRS